MSFECHDSVVVVAFHPQARLQIGGLLAVGIAVTGGSIWLFRLLWRSFSEPGESLARASACGFAAVGILIGIGLLLAAIAGAVFGDLKGLGSG